MKKKNIIIVAPHPDDETLGLGGTILKLSKTNNLILIQSSSYEVNNKKKLKKKYINLEKKIAKSYKFKKIYNLNLEATKFDTYPKNQIISKLNKIFIKSKANIIFFPWENDVHTDHRVISESVMSCIKKFNNSYLEKAFMYETPSETNFNFKKSFLPNVFIDIRKQINKKIKILKLYKSEVKAHPHPRSILAVKALSYLRGSQSGYKNAESFYLVFSNNEL